MYPTPNEPCYKNINNKAPQKWPKHTCGHPLDTAILMEEPLSVAAAIQGGSNPLYNSDQPHA
jgi:hypothetical protein